MAIGTGYQPAPLAPKESASDGCARAIREAILSGELRPGERLPPERTLSTRFGTSRLTLRAGLSQLAAAGLLRVRQGSGYVVQDYEREGGADLLGGVIALARQRGNLAAIAGELLRVRRHLARALFEQLAERWDAGSAARITAAIDAFERAIAAGDGAAIARADFDIASALVTETRSPVLALCLNPIGRVIAELSELSRAMYADPASNLAGWRLAVTWLDARVPSLPDRIADILAARDQATLDRLSRRSAKKARPRPAQ
jgi:GntR family transcriptional regulator, transcriptional repressor for pyruvate dehydrogenase complex